MTNLHDNYSEKNEKLGSLPTKIVVSENPAQAHIFIGSEAEIAKMALPPQDVVYFMYTIPMRLLGYRLVNLFEW